MSPRPLSPNSMKLTDGQVHETTKEVVQNIFSDVRINGCQYSENDIWDILLYASANRISMKAACERLEDAPSYNWMYTFLKQELLEPYSIESVEQQGNQGLQDTLPHRLTQRPQKIAMDLVLIPYYGDEATPGCLALRRRKAPPNSFVMRALM